MGFVDLSQVESVRVGKELENSFEVVTADKIHIFLALSVDDLNKFVQLIRYWSPRVKLVTFYFFEINIQLFYFVKKDFPQFDARRSKKVE